MVGNLPDACDGVACPTIFFLLNFSRLSVWRIEFKSKRCPLNHFGGSGTDCKGNQRPNLYRWRTPATAPRYLALPRTCARPSEHQTWHDEAKYTRETKKYACSPHSTVVDHLDRFMCYTSPPVNASSSINAAPPAWKVMSVIPISSSALATSLA